MKLLNFNFERVLILLLYSILAGLAGVHKLMGDFPPSWFNEKFKSSLIGLIPGGIALSFLIIVVLEIAIALVFTFALIKGEFKDDVNKSFSLWGFRLSLILFLILFFGSFLIQNYENGFQDFTYFALTLFTMRLYMGANSQAR
jgi:hypothetical protein